MAAEPQNPAQVDCRTPEGRILARIRLWPTHDAGLTGEAHPLVRWPDAEAQARSEEPVQLRERCRYVYRLEPLDGTTDLVLCEERGVTHSPAATGGRDEGFIEPGDQCGVLPLVVMRGGDSTPLARAAVEVRSVKMGYREHYRGMLDYIATQCAGLLLDSHAPTRLRLSSSWRTNRAALEQQLEFLRHTLESLRFRCAVDEVLRNPHRRLEDERDERSISRPFKAGKDFARQIARTGDRVAVPPPHPLRIAQPLLTSLPARVGVTTRTDFLDTPENRFAKMVLVEFRDFLVEIGALLGRDPLEAARPGNTRLLREVTRLRGLLDGLLGRGFLPDISRPEMLPLGSPVLQRKAGYRELLHLWLQFHVGAQLAWDGGQDVWQGGARNVATLYEYWLFFQLEALFRQKFTCDEPLHSLVVDKDKTPPQLVLKRGVQLETPVSGVWSKTAERNLKAEFQFNRKFTPRMDRTRAGSWTRGVQPDYTISIWPAEYSRQEAEEKELMVHVHFDAKYRVERMKELLGDEADDTAFETKEENKAEPRSAAKYADLLKMHAYRDAIRRTAGAYVLYPGNPEEGNKEYMGFHEVLPGLGAFAVRPDKDGKATGMDAVSAFLDRAVEHLANRTTARERVTYHVAESYVVKEAPVPYGGLSLPESDIYGRDYRALPPAEDMVLAAWYRNDDQRALAEHENGFAYVRLGRRAGSLHVHPNLARVRHVLLRAEGAVVAPGLLLLREPGFRIFTRSQLRTQLQKHARSRGVAAWVALAGADDEEHIYAMFRTKRDPDYGSQQWNGSKVMDLIGAFESDARNALVENVGRTSPYPRILPLRDVLKARI